MRAMLILMVLGCPKGGCGDDGKPRDTTREESGDESGGETAAGMTCISVPLAEEVSDETVEVPSGFEYCYPKGSEASGDYERVEAVACVSDPRAFADTCSASDEGECSSDDDCSSGLCVDAPCGYCRCVPTCVQDADCGGGQACICRVDWNPPGKDTRRETFDSLNECMVAQCRTNADCDSGVCALSLGGYTDGLYCRTAMDTCRGDGDCSYGSCAYSSGLGYWSCYEPEGCD